MKPEGYNDYKVSQVTVDGVQGERYSGIIAEDAEGIGSAKGTKEIRYVFKKDTFVYQAHYFQQPGYPDVEKDFDLVVTKTLKFTK